MWLQWHDRGPLKAWWILLKCIWQLSEMEYCTMTYCPTRKIFPVLSYKIHKQHHYYIDCNSILTLPSNFGARHAYDQDSLSSTYTKLHRAVSLNDCNSEKWGTFGQHCISNVLVSSNRCIYWFNYSSNTNVAHGEFATLTNIDIPQIYTNLTC